MNIEITPFTIWLFTRLDTLNSVLQFFVVIFGFLTFISIFLFIMTKAEPHVFRNLRRIVNRFVVVIIPFIFTILCLLAICLPTKKEVIAMCVIPQVVNNERIQKIGAESIENIFNLLDYTNKVLKDKIKK